MSELDQVTSDHVSVFETTWRATGKEYASIGGKQFRVIGSEITRRDEYDEMGIPTRLKECTITVLTPERDYPAGSPVRFRNSDFRIIETNEEGRACLTYSLESP